MTIATAAVEFTKIRRSSWPEGVHLQLDECSIMVSTGQVWQPASDDLRAADWEAYPVYRWELCS